MKHTYTDAQIQAAIDAACAEIAKTHPAMGGSITLMSEHNESTRLNLLKSALARLPEPPLPTASGKTPGEFYNELARSEESNRFMKWSDFTEEDRASENKRLYAVIDAFSGAGLEQAIAMMEAVPFSESPVDYISIAAEPAETFEAHGKTWTRHMPGDRMPCDRMPCDGDVLVFVTSDNPDVLSHAMPARAWHWGTKTEAKITGWRYADEPTPAEPVKPWTPAVGDVVTLKSGGPKMTVTDFHADGRVICKHFNEAGALCTPYFPAAALQPA